METKRGTSFIVACVKIILILLSVMLMLPSLAGAGCGCDHPPAEWAPVMPVFAPAGAEIRIYGDGSNFEVGLAYQVSVDGVAIRGGTVTANNENYIEAFVPDGVRVGPAEVKVWRKERSWWWGRYRDVLVDQDSSVFTVIPDYVAVPPVDGVFESSDFEVAVDTQGTVLLPLDLSRIQDATQFAFQFKNLALEFAAEDVVFYSRDGVDLTLFTLAVDDKSKREWGRYYGWEVDEDGSLKGRRFQDQIARSRDLLTTSDILTYWRHEFATYEEAHLPGGAYEVDSEGFHPGGTLHIEHSYIVLAIHGMKRHWFFPNNPHFYDEMDGGSETVRLNVSMRRAENPIGLGVLTQELEKTAPRSLEQAVDALP